MNYDSIDQNSKNTSIYELTMLKDKLEGEDKCAVCRAIKELENLNNSSWNNSIWLILIFVLMFSGYGGQNINMESLMKAYNDIIQKSQNEEEDGGE